MWQRLNFFSYLIHKKYVILEFVLGLEKAISQCWGNLKIWVFLQGLCLETIISFFMHFTCEHFLLSIYFSCFGVWLYSIKVKTAEHINFLLKLISTQKRFMEGLKWKMLPVKIMSRMTFITFLNPRNTIYEEKFSLKSKS